MRKINLSKTHIALISAVAIIFVLVVLGPIYIVEEGTQVVVTRFGSIVKTRTEANLYFKVPFLDVVKVYPKRILSLDGDAQRIPTKENQFIIVDTTSRWRISDPAKFYQSFKSIEAAYVRLSDIVDSAVRTVVTQNTFSEVVRSTNLIVENYVGEEIVDAEVVNEEEVEIIDETPEDDIDLVEKGRRKLSEEMANQVRQLIPEYGIELLDVVPRQIKYSDEMTASVYERMIKERNQVAQKYRSTGEGKKAEWLGKLENEKRTILSEGYRKAEEIKGTADAEAAKIYAEAYARDEEFFAFWNSIESYKKTLPKFDSTLSTDMQYFRYLYSPSGR